MHDRDREQARSYRVYRLLIDLVFCLHPYQIDPAQVPEDLQRLRRAQATTHRCSGTRCEYHNAESFSRYDLSCLRGTGQGPWLVCVCSVQTNGTLRMRLCNFMSAHNGMWTHNKGSLQKSQSIREQGRFNVRSVFQAF